MFIENKSLKGSERKQYQVEEMVNGDARLTKPQEI